MVVGDAVVGAVLIVVAVVVAGVLHGGGDLMGPWGNIEHVLVACNLVHLIWSEVLAIHKRVVRV